MQYKTRTALAAVATVLAHPFRALFAASKPHLTLTAPTLAPRGVASISSPTWAIPAPSTPRPRSARLLRRPRGRSSAARSAPMSAAIPRR